ncbi:hypothetical protein GCM10023081_12460 [Arthrobacter ginkgonis]|uniref:Uncharacterized protein n=1 Tax=Arthrobacter ginkgonis TaxID=1630594 RepID=A0ABP7C3W4_9MICC
MDHLHTSAPRAGRRPRWLAALVAVVAALFLAGGLAAPAQAAAATTVLTVSASDYSVSSGASVTVTGTLKRGSKAVSGVYVTLQKRTAGNSKWTTVKKTKTSSKGKVSAKVSKLAKNTEIRAVFSGTSKYKASKSSAKKVTVTQKVTVTKTSTTKPTKGADITLSGTTTSGLAGKKVYLQQKFGTTWKNVPFESASSKVTQEKTFTVSTKAGSAGKATYRVYAPASASTKSATSAEKAFTVYQWFKLSQTAPSSASEWVGGWKGFLPGQASINGKTFADALADFHGYDGDGERISPDQPTWSVWTVDRRCQTLEVTIGMDDDSAPGAAADFVVYGVPDASAPDVYEEFYAGTFETGNASAKRSYSVAKFDEVELRAWESETASYGLGEQGIPVFADAKVLCSSKPAA